jgi:hypothetical protein
MISAIGKFLLAAAAGAAILIVIICAVTGRWPSMVVVENRLEAATCSLAFSDGFTWAFDIKPDQERNWFFVLGRPEKVEIACTVGEQTINRLHYFCDQDFEQKIRITADETPILCLVR